MTEAIITLLVFALVILFIMAIRRGFNNPKLGPRNRSKFMEEVEAAKTKMSTYREPEAYRISKKPASTNVNFAISYRFEFPKEHLIYISNEAPERIPEIGLGYRIRLTIDKDGNYIQEEVQQPDPSTIFVNLPITQPSAHVDPPGYWPSYASLNSDQRWQYLNWLVDITQQIDTGYVFIYYYGLERQLLMGDFEGAFNEVITLRRFHKNKSFIRYSESALVYACLLRDRLDKLPDLASTDELNPFTNAQLNLAYKLGNDLSVDNLVEVFLGYKEINKRPLKQNLPLFQECLQAKFKDEYGRESFPFSGTFKLNEAPISDESAFSNYSFPKDVQFQIIHDFYAHRRFTSEVFRIFDLSYDLYKTESTRIRKLKNQK